MTDREQFEEWYLAEKELVASEADLWDAWQAARAKPAQPSKEWLDEARLLVSEVKDEISRQSSIEDDYQDFDTAFDKLTELATHLEKR